MSATDDLLPVYASDTWKSGFSHVARAVLLADKRNGPANDSGKIQFAVSPGDVHPGLILGHRNSGGTRVFPAYFATRKLPGKWRISAFRATPTFGVRLSSKRRVTRF